MADEDIVEAPVDPVDEDLHGKEIPVILAVRESAKERRFGSRSLGLMR